MSTPNPDSDPIRRMWAHRPARSAELMARLSGHTPSEPEDDVGDRSPEEMLGEAIERDRYSPEAIQADLDSIGQQMNDLAARIQNQEGDGNDSNGDIG